MKNISYSCLRYLKFVFSFRKKAHVTFVIGDCGAGKTSYATRIAMKHLKKGCPVYSNMFIQGAFQLAISDLMIYNLEDNAIIILDEASSHGLASRGNSHKASNTAEIIEFFTMYRHYAVNNVLVIAPSFADIIPIVRARTDKVLLIQNTILSKLGIGKYKFIKKKVDIPMGANEPIEVFRFLPFIRGFYLQYPTFAMFDSFSRKELKIKKWLKW